MEDQHLKPEADEDDKTESKVAKDSSSNFLESWLGLKDKEKPENVENLEEEQEDGLEKSPLRKRLLKSLKQLFSGLVTLSPEPRLEYAGSVPAPEEFTKLDMVAEASNDHSEEIDEKHSDKPANEEREQHPKTHETTDQPSTERHQPEQIGNIVKRVESESGTAIAAAEYAHRRNRAKTKKQLTKLKKEAKTARKEREEIRKQQKEFEQQLATNVDQTEKIKQTAPKVELVKVTEPISQTTESITDKPTGQTAEDQQLTSQELEKLINHKPEQKPEGVFERVETAAEHNVPIESLYERRHETKDTALKQNQIKSVSSPTGAKPSIDPRLDLTLDRDKNQAKSVSPTVINPKNQSVKQSPMYKQAVLSGFWTAVALLAVILLLVIFS